MAQDISATNRTIVSVEDDSTMIELFRFILKMEGYEVLGATNGAAGLELIEMTKPGLVLLDLLLPGMDGWEVYQRMKADVEMRGIPVIVVTCKTSSIDEILARNIAKVDDYIAKPFSPRGLVESINRVFGVSQQDSQQI